MALRLVTGRAGAGKENLCLDEIKRGTGDCGGMLIYLVPEQANLEAEHTLFNHIYTGWSAVTDNGNNVTANGNTVTANGIAGTANGIPGTGPEGSYEVAVMTFRSIARRVFAELGGGSRKYLNGVGKKIILSSIVEECRNSLVYFQGARRSESFIGDLAALFAEFKRYKISADTIENAGGGASDITAEKRTTGVSAAGAPSPRFDGRLRQKLRELSILFRRYNGYISNGYFDTDDDLPRLANIIGKSEMLLKSRIWINGFDGFTEQEYDVVIELAKRAAEVTVCLCCDLSMLRGSRESLASGLLGLLESAAGGGSGAYGDRQAAALFYPVIETAADLVARAANSGVRVTHINIGAPKQNGGGSSGARCGALRHLEQNLYRDRPAIYRSCDGAARIAQCGDAYGEAEFAADAIIALCRDSGYKYGDIAVICSDLETYAPMLDAVFGRRGLRCFIDKKNDVTDHPMVRLIFSAIAAAESNFSYDSVFSYIKTGLTRLTRDEADRLENYALARGVRGSMWTNDAIWAPGGATGANAERGCEGAVALARAKFIAPLADFVSRMKNCRGPQDFCKAVYTLLEESGARKKINDIVKNTESSPDAKKKSSEWKQIWGFMMEILDQIAEFGYFDGQSVENGSVYAEMFKCGAESYKTGNIPPSADEILIGSVDRTRSRKTRALFVLGANEGAFPGAPGHAPLLSDDDRAALRASGVKISKDSAASSFDSQYRVYRTFTTPNNLLYVSWPSALSGGKAAKPSYAVKMLEKMFAGANVKSGGGPADIERAGNDSESAFALMIRELGKSGAKGLDPQWRAVYDWFTSRCGWTGRLEKIMPSAGFKNGLARFSAPAILAAPAPSEISVSRLERYAACPFSYLSEFLAAALPRKEYKLEAPDIGVFVHRAIELAARSITEDGAWGGLTFGECEERSAGATKRLLAEDGGGVFASSQRLMYQSERVRDTVTWSLYAMSGHISEGGYRPWKFEMNFNDYAGRAAGEPFNLRGVVDRIDIASDGGNIFVRVVDYKTGRKKISLSDIDNGLTLQLPVYLEAAVNAASAASTDAVPKGAPDAFAGAKILPGGLFYFEVRQPLLDRRKTGRAGFSASMPAKTGLPAAAAEDGGLVKSLAMNGYAVGGIAEYKKNYERDIGARLSSGIISGVSVKKDGEFAAKTLAPDLDDYEAIKLAAKNRIVEIREQLGMGTYDISPYKKSGATPCSYCGYRGACGLDIMKKNEVYRPLQKKSDRDMLAIFRNLRAAGGGPIAGPPRGQAPGAGL